jgi:hypothetical protein
MGKIYAGDIGVEFILDTKQDLSQASLLQIKVMDPLNVATTWTGTATSTTKITYTTTASDNELVVGDYFFQTYVEWGSQSKHLGETFKLTVYEPYEYP